MPVDRRVGKRVLITLSVAATLLLAEGIWRLLFPRPGFTPRSELGAPGMIVPHLRRSYTPAPHWSGRMRNAEFDVPFWTDENGCRIPLPNPWRERAWCAPAYFAGEAGGDGLRRDTSERFAVLTLGDSFTFGHGLEAEASWPEQLGLRLNERLGPVRSVRIVNGAVSGYNMAQVRDRAGELVPRGVNLV